MDSTVALALGAVLLALNAFFVGAEFALVSTRRTRMELLAAGGSRLARTTLRAMERVSLMMAGAQLGITLCSLGLGAVAEPALAHLIEPALEALGLPSALLHPVAFVIALSIVVFLHVVLGEMVPKNIALAEPERSALLLGPPLMVVVTLLKPVIVALNAVANGLLRLLRVEPRNELASTYTREEVAGLIDESRREGMLEHEEYELLVGALQLHEEPITSVLLPIDGVITVRRGVTVREVEDLCADTGYSRFPVADAQGDLVGYLHVKDVLETDPARRARPVADKWVRPLVTVSSDDLLFDALRVMQRRGVHLARVARPDGDKRRWRCS